MFSFLNPTTYPVNPSPPHWPQRAVAAKEASIARAIKNNLNIV
jgi:hypothetical protein